MIEEDEVTEAQLTHQWDVRGIDVATLKIDERGTIVPMRVMKGQATKPISGELSGIRALPELLVSGPEESIAGAEVELGETLGEGGMGMVWAGRQVPLRRDVAVKSVHPRATEPETTYALLREARITGALEHPNVVPIHALGKNEQGRPIIIMKRIEGTTWGDLLSDQSRHGPGAVMSHLEYHIEVLIDVAKAVHFAHSRGIIHRDIKPDNVMIGGFGEVYVVDWGIAVHLRSTELDMPLAKDVQVVTGSPAYMAPEMAIGDGPNIDERTDVYLLGATLHEIITGRPPHAAPSTVKMLTNAYASAPQAYDAAVPADLVEICHTAMARKPSDRYQSAAAFAAALQRLLKHRDSTLLADEAAARLEDLREALGSGHRDRDALYNLFNECRFGFTHALRIWDSNTRARELLQAALELMIDYELATGSAGAAAALLGDLPIPSSDLRERVDEKRAAENEAQKELESLKHRLDPTAADRPRAYLSFVVAIAWALTHAGMFYVEEHTAYAVRHLQFALAYGLFAVAAVGSGVIARETLLIKAASGVQTQLTVTLFYTAMACGWLLAADLDMSLAMGVALSLFVGALVWTAGAIAVDRRLLSWGAALAVGLLGVLLRPDNAILWIGAAGTTGATLLGLLRMRTKRNTQMMPLSEQLSAILTSRREG
jgi:serine/threonine-protein kinase